MKKLFCLVVLSFVSFSCSKSDENETELNAIDPTKLVKVIFFPGALNERHWNFYDNGLLKEITKRWPAVEFMSTTELGRVMYNN